MNRPQSWSEAVAIRNLRGTLLEAVRELNIALGEATPGAGPFDPLSLIAYIETQCYDESMTGGYDWHAIVCRLAEALCELGVTTAGVAAVAVGSVTRAGLGGAR